MIEDKVEDTRENAVMLNLLGDQLNVLLDPVQNPKAAHFAAAIIGDYLAVTMDKVMSNTIRSRVDPTKDIAGRGKEVDAPNLSSYEPDARFIQIIAETLGIAPTDLQAKIWIGSEHKEQIPGVAAGFDRTVMERISATKTLINMGVADMITIMKFQGYL